MWQEGIGSLLLLAAAQQTGLLTLLETTIQRVAAHSKGLPLNPVVIERLVLTLLFLPVAGLARTWDLRTYTGTLLALVTGRGCAYSYAYVEQFLSRLAHAGADESLTDAVAQWTWTLWHEQRGKPEQEQEKHRAVFYVDGHRKAVDSDVLVPRGPIGKLGGKILGCRELVVLHDQEGHPRLSTTHRGDQHLTIGAPELVHRYEQATDRAHLSRLVIDREGMAAEFLFQLSCEGRCVVTLLRSNQYEDEGSFTEVGEWVPWRADRSGKVVCEVASAQFQLARPTQPDQPLAVRVALIRDWRKLIVCEAETDAGEQWKADLASDNQNFWEPEWQATPAPPAPTRPKLIPVVTTVKRRRPVVIFIDEAQHLDRVSSERQRQNQLDCIKDLANETGTIFVLIGTYELLPLRDLSAQLIGRSLDIHFPRYRSTEKELSQFKNVLRTFQDALPFVGETDILLKHWEFCYERSIGCVGNLRLMLVRAVHAALWADAKTLSWNHLKTTGFREAESYEMMREAYKGESRLASNPTQRTQLRKMLGLASPVKSKKRSTT